MSAAYRVEFDPQAGRQLRKLDPQIKKMIGSAIDVLAANPHAANLDIKAIKGRAGSLRLRVGNYRIVYDLYDDELLVWVIELGHRREIYR